MNIPQQKPPQFATPKGNERDRLVAARAALLLGEPLFGIIVSRLKLTDVPWIMTAGTDGKRFCYNPAYIAALSDDEITGLWVHEAFHIMDGHLWRFVKGMDQHTANLAMDYAIDPLGKKYRFTIPNETVNPEWHGWAWEQIYEALIQEQQKQQKQGGQGKPGKQGQCKGNGQGKGKDGDKDGNGSGAPKGAPTQMPAKDFLMLPEETEQLKSEWKQVISAAAQIAKMRGKLPGDLELLVGDLLAPKVAWRSLLHRFAQAVAKSDFTWKRPSMRYMPLGCYLPSLHSEQMPPIVIGWDTSGSMNSPTIRAQIGGEVQSIIDEVRPEITHCVYFDDGVQRVQEFDPYDVIKPMPKGGGGTSFIPVFDWIEEQGIEPACLIMVTDCYGDYPDAAPSYPVLWACTTKPSQLGHYTPPFGELVYIDEEGIEE